MSTVVKDLGAVSAYAYAVEKGYTGTEAEFAELMADYAEVGQRAEDAANSALESKTAAQTAATTATNKASEAATSAQTATTKAGEATTAAGTATTAKNDAVAAKTAAETAQGKAEDAQAAAESVAESIPSDYSQLSEDVSDLKEGLTESEIYKKTVNDVVISNSSYKYAFYNNSKFTIYPVNPGDEVEIKAGSVATYYTVLTTDEVIVGSFPDYATGYSKLETIARSLTETITIPQDGRYILIVFLSGGNVLTPNFVKLGSYDLLKNVPDNFSDLSAYASELNGDIEDFENNTLKLYADISMFDDIAVCGDSYTAGEIYSSGSLIGANEKTRWGTVLSRMTGADVATYASGGADTNTWQSRSDCLPKLLNDSPHELYILCLGINDKTYVTLGSTSDMEHAGTVVDPFPNTFYGNYASIITQIRSHAPNAKIIISKVFIVTLVSGQYYQWSSEAIEEIANHFNIPFIETADDSFFSSVWFNTNMVSGHPVAVTYAGIAKAMKHLISKCILDNTSYFADYYPN